jgi:WD40 repeat protein
MNDIDGKELENARINAKKYTMCHILKGHTGAINGVAYHPDGKHLISSAWKDRARLWDLSSKSVLYYGPYATSLVIDKEGKKYASMLEPYYDKKKVIQIWHHTDDYVACEKAKLVHEYFVFPFVPFVFNPQDSNKLVAVFGNTICFWDTLYGGHKNYVGLADKNDRDSASSIAYSPDGNDLAFGTERGSVALWKNGRPENYLRCTQDIEIPTSARIRTIAYNPHDNNQVASGNSFFKLWDTRNLKSILTIKPQDYRWICNINVTSIAYKPDGTQIAYANTNGIVNIIELRLNKVLFSFKCGQEVLSVAYHPDGKQIAFGLEDGTIQLHDLLW